MAGNVWEWNRDWYGRYMAASAADPLGPVAEKAEPLAGPRVRVVRGGAFCDYENHLRAAYRGNSAPADREAFIGFRVVSSRFRP